MISSVEADELPSRAVSTVKQAPDHWIKRSVSWTLEVGNLGAQMTIWEDGDIEIDLVDMAAREATAEHRKVNSERDIQLAVRTALDWVLGQPLADDVPR
jgi:hypothetical protein